jgi:hypothetical protein
MEELVKNISGLRPQIFPMMIKNKKEVKTLGLPHIIYSWSLMALVAGQTKALIAGYSPSNLSAISR